MENISNNENVFERTYKVLEDFQEDINKKYEEKNSNKRVVIFSQSERIAQMYLWLDNICETRGVDKRREKMLEFIEMLGDDAFTAGRLEESKETGNYDKYVMDNVG